MDIQKLSRRQDYLFLVLLSAITSGLIVCYGLSVVDRVSAKPGDFVGGVILWALLLIQQILIIPATFAVYAIYSSQYKGGSRIICFGVPLVANILGANLAYIMMYVRDTHVLNSIHYRNVDITIKSETVIPWRPSPDSGYLVNENYPYEYQVVLHINNPLRENLPGMSFYLGAYDDKVLRPASAYNEWYIAHGLYKDSLPPGESDIIADFPVGIGFLQCDNTDLTKPLYLLYSIDNGLTKPIAVSESINKLLQEIACSPPAR